MAKGYCFAHYKRSRKGQDMDAPIATQRHLNGSWGDWYTNSRGYIERHRTVGGVRESQLQHRLVMAERLGRELLPGENVHHINGNRSDNSLENLELWVSRQPKGQRVDDLLEYADEIIRLYRT